MVIGLLQFELLIPEAESLKDKRQVVRSVKDKLHREHLVSVAEIGNPDDFSTAMLGVALVSRDGRHASTVLDAILAKLRALGRAELGDFDKQIIRPADETRPECDDEAAPAEQDRGGAR